MTPLVTTYPLPAHVARTVRVHAIRDYMLKTGWVEQPLERPGERLLFEHPSVRFASGELAYQLIPNTEAVPDYHREVERIVHSLSVIEDRPPEAIVRDLTGGRYPEPPADPTALAARLDLHSRLLAGLFAVVGAACGLVAQAVPGVGALALYGLAAACGVVAVVVWFTRSRTPAPEPAAPPTSAVGSSSAP